VESVSVGVSLDFEPMLMSTSLTLATLPPLDDGGAPVAAYVIELIGTVAEEMKLDDGVEIILKLESSGEMEASLLELLEEEFESNDEFEYTGEEIVSLLEKVCEVEWTTKDEDDAEDDEDDEDEDDPDGFFDAMGGDDEDE
jgi:hypothetical protein